MRVLSRLRSLVPKPCRAALLKNKVTSTLIRSFVKQDQLRQHPQCGCRLAFDGHRSLGWATGGLATWEQDYFEACRRMFLSIQPQVVWDVGANVGIWTLFFAESFASVSTVVAYEPDQVNLRMLERNVAINALPHRVQVRPVALSAKTGSADFQVDAMTGSTGSLELNDAFITRYYGRQTSRTTVAITTVDQELADGVPPPDFLKIDVEGHEADLFRGAQRLLTVIRPVMIVEFTGVRCGQAVDELRRQGYVFLCPKTGEQRPHREYEMVGAPKERVEIISAALAGKA